MDGNAFIEGEFVGLMFDENIAPDIREYFESVLSHYSVFMAQQGTPTVSNHFMDYVHFLGFYCPLTVQFGESLMAASAPVQERVTSASRQTKDAASSKANVIGQDAALAEEELPYDTSRKTGKLAAALMTGRMKVPLMRIGVRRGCFIQERDFSPNSSPPVSSWLRI